MWQVSILTLFPKLYPGPLSESITGRALQENLCRIEATDIRDYSIDKHRSIDDTPYGGGGGMVMRADVLGAAIENVFLTNRNKIIYFTPRGQIFNQATARSLIESPGINIICGRFEGLDERVISEYKIVEISVGDFVLSSGDIAAFSVLDACIRLLPGVLGNDKSLEQESFGTSKVYSNILEYPHFTKPPHWKGRAVPPVLLSGNHKLIEEWRLAEAKKRTRDARPDLWLRYLEEENK
jgi:tRNA (guanine37-N1)-methyltransferase